LGLPSRRTNNFPESGRSLGHVTPTIFGSTVGYPSDSLASCISARLHIAYMLSALYAIARPSVSDAIISPYGESMACCQRLSVVEFHAHVTVQQWYEKS